MGAAVCPRCARDVALHEGRPFVAVSGQVELWHATCWQTRHERIETTPIVTAPRRRARIPYAAIAAGLGVVAFAAFGYGLRLDLPSASLAAIDTDVRESLALRASSTTQESAPAEVDIRDLYPVPIVHDMPLDEMYPSLLDWIHPVTATDAPLPEQSAARFGSNRDGVALRPECGQGHCGIDLVGPVGRPIVAVGDGVIVRIERSQLGRDGRSGRYVRIEHPDGTLTAYMHLDTIEPGLEVGDSVDGGQQIGTLGTTGTNGTTPPHVHFALEVPKVPGTHGDHANTTYVDPAPFLVRATVAEAADRRRPEKPAF
jgi:murein DD-endopeptidase MepM/ murein hydrolase activator NlpD